MSDHLLSSSAIDQHHSGLCPPVTVKKGVLGKWLRKGGVVVISWKLREEVVSGILLEGLEITQPWTVGELDVPGNRLGTTSCSASQPSLRPSNNLGTGVEEQWTSPSSLSVQTTSSGLFLGVSHWELVSSPEQPEDTGPVVLGAWLHQGWELGRMWEPCPEGAAKWDLFLLNQDFKMKVVPWDFALSWQGKNDRK